MFTLAGPNGHTEWSDLMENEVFSRYGDDIGRDLYERLRGLIDEMTDNPDFDYLDVLALKMLLQRAVERMIDGLVDKAVEKKGLEYDDTEVTPFAENRIHEVIFWGSGNNSGLQGEIVLSRLNKAIAFCPCQQISLPEEDKKNREAALRCMNDFANAVFGMDAQLVPSETARLYHLGRYEKTLCSVCPHSRGFEEFVEHNDNCYCNLDQSRPACWRHPLDCVGLAKEENLEAWLGKLSDSLGAEAMKKYAAKYAAILAERGPYIPVKREETGRVDKSDW